MRLPPSAATRAPDAHATASICSCAQPPWGLPPPGNGEGSSSRHWCRPRGRDKGWQATGAGLPRPGTRAQPPGALAGRAGWGGTGRAGSGAGAVQPGDCSTADACGAGLWRPPAGGAGRGARVWRARQQLPGAQGLCCGTIRCARPSTAKSLHTHTHTHTTYSHAHKYTHIHKHTHTGRAHWAMQQCLPDSSVPCLLLGADACLQTPDSAVCADPWQAFPSSAVSLMRTMKAWHVGNHWCGADELVYTGLNMRCSGVGFM